MFIIDFDDTLFDTYSFKKEIINSLKNIGVSEKLYSTSYKRARNKKNGDFAYSFERHAKFLALEGFDFEKIKQAFENIDIKNFLFSDAIDFLQSLKKYNQPIILLSLGDPNFQETKVKNCGIEKYFDRIFFVGDSKEKILTELFENIDEENIWFINDKVLETKNLVRKFNNLKIVLKKSLSIEDYEYKKSGLPFFETLINIKEYVRDNI
jgi:FMN phosphatase YigB (HAD superfamily)